jgi:HlyD family secretion protein
MKRQWVLTLALASLAVSAGAYYEMEPARTAVRFETVRATRGDVVAKVVCTGTLQAMKSVDVATQANGVIKELDADFNSVVRAGQVIARLDPSLIQAQVDQGRAALERAKANVEELGVTRDETARQLTRAEALHAKALVTDEDLENARVAAEQASADIEAAEAEVAQTEATIKQNLLALDHTIITSPINGIVIARNVDVGQTVVSTQQAQSLFQIAEDLTKLHLEAAVDESDVGHVKPGDPVSFTVDAYPGETFSGTVTQVRDNPNLDQNVVSYTTVVDVSNPSLKLRPGMTANIVIRVEMRANALQVPENAVRFKPNDELFGLLHQAVPSAAHADSAVRSGVARSALAVASRAAVLKPGRAAASDAHQLWVLRNGRLQAVPVHTGLTDGTCVEIVDGKLSAGDEVVLNAISRK